MPLRGVLGVLVLVALVLVARVHAAFICESRAAAVALAQAVCALDAECRWAVNVPPPGGAAGWDTLLTQQARLLAADDALPPPATPDDPRALLWPTAPAWRPWPLLAWSSTYPANVACAALAATVGTGPLAPELYVLLYALDVHQARLALTRGCDDANQLAIFDPVTGNVTCECAPDKECRAPGFDVDTGLLWAIAIGAGILVMGATLYLIVASALQTRRMHKLEKHAYRAVPRDGL
jgi:hypothetical protein